MADAEIHYQLDLIVRLLDTTTGKRIEQRQVIFKSEDQVLTFLRRDAGLYILLNRGRNDMTLDIQVVGYLPARVNVCYDELPKNFPEVEVAMIPEALTGGFVDMLTLEGICEGLESIEAVSLKNPHGAVDSYQERKQTLKLYYSKPFEETTYAVIHEQDQEFEKFQIKKRVDKLSVKLADPMKTACRPEEKIARIVHGRVDENGRYLLRILEDGGGAEYLIRFVVNGNESFKRISMENLGSLFEPERS